MPSRPAIGGFDGSSTRSVLANKVGGRCHIRLPSAVCAAKTIVTLALVRHEQPCCPWKRRFTSNSMCNLFLSQTSLALLGAGTFRSRILGEQSVSGHYVD